jgi:hypothetical protein
MLLVAIYATIASGFEQKHGFWKSLVWPYYLGVLIGDAIERRSALERSDGCPVNSGNIGEN